MSKMGEELEKRLEENKCELYYALQSILWDLRQGAIPNDLTEFEEVLAKVEGVKK